MSNKKKRDARNPKRETKPAPKATGFAFGPTNYATFATAVAAIVAGYVLLDQGSVTAAPLLLIFGYAVLLPLGLVLGWRRIG